MRNSARVFVAQPFLAVRRKPPPIPEESSLIATVPLESCPKDFHQRKTSTGRNACATQAPTAHDLLPPQPSSLASRRQIHLYHLEAVRLFARLRAQENSHSHE